MEFLEGIAALPIIVATVYAVMEVYKQIANGKERALNLIPAFAGLLGIALGAVMFFLAPEMIPANNLFTALLIGGVSGLSATGINQTAKQLKSMVKPADTEKPEGDKDNTLTESKKEDNVPSESKGGDTDNVPSESKGGDTDNVPSKSKGGEE